MVKLQIAKGAARMIPLILFIVFSIIGLRQVKKANYDKLHWNIHANLSLVFGAMSLLMFILALCCTYSGILHLFAPEWYAILEILAQFK